MSELIANPMNPFSEFFVALERPCGSTSADTNELPPMDGSAGI
ncbi:MULTISPECIES: hypothetical protein [Bradyrhizobium]|nr:hypothetical protein [Bradyrhizobium zhengyangense]